MGYLLSIVMIKREIERQRETKRDKKVSPKVNRLISRDIRYKSYIHNENNIKNKLVCCLLLPSFYIMKTQPSLLFLVKLFLSIHIYPLVS